MAVTDNIWHHVCVLWEIRDEQLEVFKDGQRKHVSIGFQSNSQRVGIEGTVEKITLSFKQHILLTFSELPTGHFTINTSIKKAKCLCHLEIIIIKLETFCLYMCRLVVNSFVS